MEELTYLRTKKCACCYERLDKMPKRNILNYIAIKITC